MDTGCGHDLIAQKKIEKHNLETLVTPEPISFLYCLVCWTWASGGTSTITWVFHWDALRTILWTTSPQG